jgi:DNA polymerase II small subunit
LTDTIDKKNIISFLLEKEVLIEEDVMNLINSSIDHIDLYDYILKKNSNDLILNKNILIEYLDDIENKKTSQKLNEIEINDRKTIITWEYEENTEKKKYADFVKMYKNRYDEISSILKKRLELSNSISISRLQYKPDNEKVALVVSIYEISLTKNGALIFDVDDPTGKSKLIVSKKNEKMFNLASELCHDDIIGIVGTKLNDVVFPNDIILPDVPLTKELKKSPIEEYVAFMSDIHVGSDKFLKNEFELMIDFLCGNYGTDEHKEISKKIKYIFVTGDLVEGVGVFPGMENRLTILSLKEQFDEFARYMKKIPKDKTIIICPGNHDGVRLAEPQPKLHEDYAEELYKMENVIMTTNPAYVNVGRTKKFSGIDILMYHGWSLVYYANKVPTLLKAGGVENISHVMKYLLQRRHLSPFHKANQKVINSEYDPMIIRKIPDIFVTGHVHKCSIQSYRNVTLLCGSAWEDLTEMNEKFGFVPEPCRLPLINLKTRQVKVLKFGDIKSDEDEK